MIFSPALATVVSQVQGAISPAMFIVLAIFGFGFAIMAAAALMGHHPHFPDQRRFQAPQLIQKEADLAMSVGMPFDRWVMIRVVSIVVLTIIGILTGVWILAVALFFAGVAGVPWAFSGRAASRQMKMERAFVDQLRNLRDRMAVSNQPLDTALQEIGRNPGPGLAYVLEPLSRGGSVVANIVETGIRSRSPIVEYACAVLIWSRTRSLDDLVSAIDEVLLDVGSAQLEVREETMTTLSQQRAVTIAMAALMGGMLAAVLRTPNFHAYYQTLTGQIVLALALLVFLFLVWLLGKMIAIQPWTRWDLRAHANAQEQMGG